MDSSPYTSGPFSLVAPRAKDGVGRSGRIDAEKLAKKARRLLMDVSFSDSDGRNANRFDGLSVMGVGRDADLEVMAIARW